MVSFAEFLIKFFEKLGIFYTFSLIFIGVSIFIVVYFLLSLITIKKGEKQEFLFSDSARKTIAIILAFVVAILAGHLYNVSLVIRYFVSIVSIMIILIFFILVSYSFIIGEKPSISENWKKNFAILITIFIVTFVFIAIYYAFREYFIALNVGGGGISSEEAKIFRLIFRPEIMIIPFLFVFMGLVAWLLGREEKTS